MRDRVDSAASAISYQGPSAAEEEERKPSVAVRRTGMGCFCPSLSLKLKRTEVGGGQIPRSRVGFALSIIIQQH